MPREKVSDGSLVGKKLGKDNQIVVQGFVGYRRVKRDKLFKVHCSVCSKDPELFGDGSFVMTKYDLMRGQVPCGCSERVAWTAQQYEVMVRRKCDEKNYEFLGFSAEWKGKHTKLRLLCNEDGTSWETTNIDSLLSNHGCPTCKYKTISQALAKPDEDMVEGFMSSGSFRDGTIFSRIKGKKWSYTCPVCSVDEYVQAGVCGGVFFTDAGHLREGTKTCRCSTRFSWTRQQREYRLHKLLEQTPEVTFLRWADGMKNVRSRVSLHCVEHGKWDVSIDSVLRLGVHCPGCGHEAIGDKLRIPEEIRQTQIADIIQRESLNYTFLGWQDEYIGSKTILRMRCEEHGEWWPALSEFVITGARCPSCAISGFDKTRPAHVYVLSIQGKTADFTGYGISTDYEWRLRTHKRNLSQMGFAIQDVQVFPCLGETAQQIEKLIKGTFPRFAQEVTGFKTEATYIEHHQAVLDFVENSLTELAANT